MTQITYSIDDSQTRATLSDLLAASQDLTPAMEGIGSYLVFSTQQRFEDQRGPDGTPWPPSIRAQLEGGVTLTKSARLKQSQTYQASSRSVEAGTNVIYAGVHQGGAIIRAKTARGLRFRIGDQWVRKESVEILARPFLGINEEDERDIQLELEDYLAQAAGPGAGA